MSRHSASHGATGRAGPICLHRVVVGVLDTNCWIVHARAGSSALVVDPGDDAARIVDELDRNGLTLVGVVLTHAHFDHVLAIPALLAHRRVPVYAHPADAPVWPAELDYLRAHGHWDAGTATPALVEGGDPSIPSSDEVMWDGRTTAVVDSARLPVDGLQVTVIHTPGHTPGSLCLALTDADGVQLLTGDTLFPGGPGLTGASWPLSDFDQIIASVTRLMRYPDATAVHPGHGPSTTIGEQRPHLGEWRRRGW